MARYLVFSFENYYPEGGLDDIILKTNYIKEVKEYIEVFENEPDIDQRGLAYKLAHSDNMQVYDTSSGRTIYDVYKTTVYGNGIGGRVNWKHKLVENVNLLDSE